MQASSLGLCPRAIGVIPARWGSTRLPGKSLISLCGRPLVAWVVDRARQAVRLDEIIVATDDVRIARVVNDLGVEAVMTDPELPSGTDRVAAAVAGRAAEIVVNLQGDEPLIDPRLLDALVERLAANPTIEMATAATPIPPEEDPTSPSIVKVVWDAEGRALYFSRSVIPHIRDPKAWTEGAPYWRHLGIYAYRRAFLERFVSAPPSLLERAEKLEQLRALHLGARIDVVTTQETGVGVDTPEDVPKVEKLLREALVGRSI